MPSMQSRLRRACRAANAACVMVRKVPRRGHADVETLRLRLRVACCGQQDLVGVAAGARSRSVAHRRLELLTLPVFQLVPHALIAISVMAHPEAFSARV